MGFPFVAHLDADNLRIGWLVSSLGRLAVVGVLDVLGRGLRATDALGNCYILVVDAIAPVRRAVKGYVGHAVL